MYMLIKKSSYRLASNLALILVLLITGCNLPGNSVEPTQPEIPTPTTTLPSPTPAEPCNPVRSIRHCTMAWRMEHGLSKSILTGLRFLAGEVFPTKPSAIRR